MQTQPFVAAMVASVAIIVGVAGTVQAQRPQKNLNGHRPKQHFNGAPPRPVPGVSPQFGNPLPDLTAEQTAAFNDARNEFENQETPDGGLGPIFNNVSCSACHSLVTSGGGGPATVNVTRFGKLTNGVFDPMTAEGGSLLQQNAIDPAVREVVPATATIVAQRQTTPLFGIGLIEAISDDDIRQNALRQKPDGIQGKVAQIEEITTGQTRVGRLGWKAQHATLLGFAGDAYLNEMGITNRFFPTENAPNGNLALLAQFDTTADPEDTIDPATGTSDIDTAATFMRLLGAPPPLRLTASAMNGQKLFDRIGCSGCHLPVMTTAPNTIAALSSKTVPLYSDLLLHDMGTLGDGIAQAAAGPRDMRTAPLWGLRASAPYLHDGRATTIDDAIRAHAGEGAPSQRRYVQLSDADRKQLLEFLGSI